MLEQQQIRTRARTLSVQIPPQPLTTAPSAGTAAMSYGRPLSPGGRRIQNPARASDSFADPYYNQVRHNSYTSPRSSGVIPLSTETFVTYPGQPQSAREPPPGSAYAGPMADARKHQRRYSGSSHMRPKVVQEPHRPSSPQKPHQPYESQTTTAARSGGEHRKVYSVQPNGSAQLVADIDSSGSGERERHHRRRDSETRYREPDRSRKYHPNGYGQRPRDKSVDDEGAFSYTTPAGMYQDTEPKWRESRPRRGSVDRSNGVSRERPKSMMLDPGASYNPRTSARELGRGEGPPLSGGARWDRINDIGRSTSVRMPRVAQSPVRGRPPQEPGASGKPGDPYYVPPRRSSRDGCSTANHYDRPVETSDRYDAVYDRQPRERRASKTRYDDREVATRGFGIRAPSKDRFPINGHGSDESFERRQLDKFRPDSAYEPHRRDTAPELSYHEEKRLEQEKLDRQREREKRRDDDRTYDKSYERDRPRERERDDYYETDRERERQRAMDRDRPDDRDRERDRESHREHHHHRRETADRDDRKENGDRPGHGQAATGGLAGAAAAFGLGKLFNKDKDKPDDRERERDRDYDRDSDREKERKREREREREREEKREREQREREKEREREQREKERERERLREKEEAERQRYEEPPRKDDREKRPRGPESYSEDSAPYDREARADRGPRDSGRGLGFAFEKQPEPPAERRRDRDYDAPRAPAPEERVQQRDFEQEHERKTVEMPQMPNSTAEEDAAAEDYRRRMEQVQRELGRTGIDDRVSSDSDPDRERRKRERDAQREQWRREKEERELQEPKLNAGVGMTGINEQAPPPQLRRSFEDTPSEANTASSTHEPGLRRKPSILDQPMSAEPAQIIDNSLSERRENRVRIVDPPTEEEMQKPKGILKKPTKKFPEYKDIDRPGVAKHKSDPAAKGIPPGARWTRIDRKLVNPEALEHYQERFEERMDCVIVLRVLTKEEIQKLADKTKEIRDGRYEDERSERSDHKSKSSKRRDRERDGAHRKDDYDEYSDNGLEPWERHGQAPKMLEAPASAGASEADFIRQNERRRDRESDMEDSYMSGGLGERRRDDEHSQY